MLCKIMAANYRSKFYELCNFYDIYLFIWILTSLSTHCIGHITTGSFMERGNQYIQLAKVLYCKLPTNCKQLPAFPLEVEPGTKTLMSEVGGESIFYFPLWILISGKLPFTNRANPKDPNLNLHYADYVCEIHLLYNV